MQLVNEKGKLLDVQGQTDGQNRALVVSNQNKQHSQDWDIVYEEDMKDEPTKGQLNEDFGFYVERPFHIISMLPSRRYVDIIDRRNIVIKTPNSYKSQVWWFDQKSRTVKSQMYPNESLDIQNAGRNKNLQIWKSNSGWF